MKHIGEKIKELRRARDMTQDELASALGVTYQTVSKWETGANSPDLSLIVPIARLFGVTTDELFCFSESADELKRAELQKRYEETYKTGSMPDRMAVCEEAVKEFPGDMKWLNEYAWCIWCNAVVKSDDEEFRVMRDRATELFRKVIENCNDDGIKANAVEGIVQCLPEKGENSEAMHYAELFPQSEFDSGRREELIVSCLTGEARAARREELLMKKFESLLRYLDLNVKAGRETARKMIELFFPDGKYYRLNDSMRTIALADARADISAGKLDEAVGHMKEARRYAEKLDELDSRGEYNYSSPLFSRVKEDPADWCKTGDTTSVDDYLALFEWPAYAPLKQHKEYEQLIKR